DRARHLVDNFSAAAPHNVERATSEAARWSLSAGGETRRRTRREHRHPRARLPDCSVFVYYANSSHFKGPDYMAKPTLRLVAPANENRTVKTPTRRPNAEYRQREYLTPTEVEKLIGVAGKNRHGHRDATMLLVCYRHGLRAS